MEKIDEGLIAEIVRKVLAEQAGILESRNQEKHKDISGITGIRGGSVKCEAFDTGKPGDKVYLKDVFTLEDNRNLAAGFMEMDGSEFEWTLNYDEIDYIIEGTLEIKTGDRKVSGSAGDAIMIPKGSSIRFSAPGYVKFFYVTYPANWAEQK